MPPVNDPEHFDPYYRWLAIPPKDQPPNHYRLLGLELFEADLEVIRDAGDRQTAHVRTYHLGPYSELSQKILNELAAAKVCLQDREKKAAYDAQLKAKLLSAQPPSQIVPGDDADAHGDADEGAAKEAAMPIQVSVATVAKPVLARRRPGVDAASSTDMPDGTAKHAAEGVGVRWLILRWKLLIGTALGGFALLVVAMILIRITKGDRETKLRVPEGSDVTIRQDSSVDVVLGKTERAGGGAVGVTRGAPTGAQAGPTLPSAPYGPLRADSQPTGKMNPSVAAKLPSPPSPTPARAELSENDQHRGHTRDLRNHEKSTVELPPKTIPETIDAELRLPRKGGPYRLEDRVNITKNGALLIERGTSVLAAPGSAILASGILNSYGEGNEFVQFRPESVTLGWDKLDLEPGVQHTMERFDVRGANRGLYIGERAKAEIRDCLFVQNKVGVETKTTLPNETILLANCLVADNLSDGITFFLSHVKLDHCTISGNGGIGLSLVYCGDIAAQGCTIAGNGIGIQSKNYETHVAVASSNIFSNRTAAIVVKTEQDFQCRGNYWGSDDPQQIKTGIDDGLTHPGKGFVVFKGFAREPVRDAGCTLKIPEFPAPAPPPNRRTAGNCPTQAQDGGGRSIPDPIDSEVRLARKDGPFILDDRVTIAESGALCIERGTVIRAKAGAALIVRGELVSYGQGDDFIKFRAAMPGVLWDKILLEKGPQHRIEHFDVRGGNQGIMIANGAAAKIVDCALIENGIGAKVGSHDRQKMAVSFQNCWFKGNRSHGVELWLSPARFDHCTFADNGGCGINLSYYGHPDINACVLTGNDLGLQTKLYDTYVDMRSSNVFGNRRGAVEVKTKYDLHCEGNYWGANDRGQIARMMIYSGRNPDCGKVLFEDFKGKPIAEAGCTLKLPRE